MSRIVVLGAGMCGLATGMMLARDGHAVTVLERDQAPVPDSPEQAWEDWSRDGVAQFRQAHYLQPGGRAVLESTLPDVAAALEAAGAIRFDALCMLPPRSPTGRRAPATSASSRSPLAVPCSNTSWDGPRTPSQGWRSAGASRSERS